VQQRGQRQGRHQVAELAQRSGERDHHGVAARRELSRGEAQDAHERQGIAEAEHRPGQQRQRVAVGHREQQLGDAHRAGRRHQQPARTVTVDEDPGHPERGSVEHRQQVHGQSDPPPPHGNSAASAHGDHALPLEVLCVPA
jgi:hypothetical protein